MHQVDMYRFLGQSVIALRQPKCFRVVPASLGLGEQLAVGFDAGDCWLPNDY